VANGKNNYPELSICVPQAHSSAAAPEAVGLLRTLLSEQPADLQAITQTIESDLSLTVQLFHLAGQRPGTVPPGVSDISEIVVHLGRKNLKAMIAKKVISMNSILPAQRTLSLLTS
jgi:c-di-GMP-related signal transduction protein